MSDYPDTSPWGPHGPEVPSNSVTPNPTAYTPEPQAPSTNYYPPPSYSYGGGGYAGDFATGPKRKSLILAGLWPFFFGPLGLLYTYQIKRPITYLFIVVACVLVIAFMANHENPITQALWWIACLASMVWNVARAIKYNRQLKN